MKVVRSSKWSIVRKVPKVLVRSCAQINGRVLKQEIWRREQVKKVNEEHMREMLFILRHIGSYVCILSQSVCFIYMFLLSVLFQWRNSIDIDQVFHSKYGHQGNIIYFFLSEFDQAWNIFLQKSNFQTFIYNPLSNYCRCFYIAPNFYQH